MDTELLKSLGWFNLHGSSLTVTWPDGQITPFSMIDSYTIVRELGSEFWVMWRATGYQDEPHYTHTIKVVAAQVGKDGSVQMTDDTGRVYDIKPLADNSAWVEWLRYRHLNEGTFENIDAHLFEEHEEIARMWL